MNRALWLLFGLQVAGALLWAELVDRSAAAPQVSGAIVNGSRFGLGEAKRQQLFQELVRGEPGDRTAAAQESESAIWNRNRDSYFHQRELGRLSSVTARLGIPLWLAFLILDEGIRQHWAPPVGVELFADDAPLRQVTRPLRQRHLIAVGPAPLPPAPLPPAAASRP